MNGSPSKSKALLCGTNSVRNAWSRQTTAVKGHRFRFRCEWEFHRNHRTRAQKQEYCDSNSNSHGQPLLFMGLPIITLRVERGRCIPRWWYQSKGCNRLRENKAWERGKRPPPSIARNGSPSKSKFYGLGQTVVGMHGVGKPPPPTDTGFVSGECFIETTEQALRNTNTATATRILMGKPLLLLGSPYYPSES